MKNYDEIILNLRPNLTRKQNLFEPIIIDEFSIHIEREHAQENYSKKLSFEIFVQFTETKRDIGENKNLMDFLIENNINYYLKFNHNKLINFIKFLEKYSKLELFK